MRKLIDLALAAAFTSTLAAPALADSKSAGEFALNTCLAAMDDIAKVKGMARERNWTTHALPDVGGMMSRSAWDVMQDDDRFFVTVGTMMLTPPLNSCIVLFPSKNVKRDDFFNAIAASAELTFLRDSKTARSLVQTYEIKSDRTNKLMLTIISASDGTLMGFDINEFPRFPPTPAIPG
jgi:hypothetical protein